MNTKLPKRSLEQEVEIAIQQGLKELLENKHLYQSVTVELNAVRSRLPETEQDEFKVRLLMGGGSGSPITNDDVKNAQESIRQLLVKRVSKWTNGMWVLVDERTADSKFRFQNERLNGCAFVIPAINVCCSKCKSGPWPHNPARESDENGYASESVVSSKEGVQVFLLPFLCQKCREEQVCFLIRREGLKLTLVGRSQFPEVLVPAFIPENQRKFYRNAVVVNQANFTLAAALYLRTIIERHFYQEIPSAEIKAIKGNPTGDELADLYAKTLPKNFPGNFPSLKKAYDDLSRIIHSGKEDDEADKSFEAIRTAVDGHFKAVQLFKEMPTQ